MELNQADILYGDWFIVPAVGIHPDAKQRLIDNRMYQLIAVFTLLLSDRLCIQY